MSLPSVRQTNFLAAVFGCFLLLVAFALQRYEALLPCSLCVLQRLTVFLLTIIFLIAAIHVKNRLRCKIYGAVTLLISLLGAAFSLRQLWLQVHPALSEGGVCAPNFVYAVKQLPLTEAVKALLSGSGDCANIEWMFIGISIPAWTLLGFSIFILIGLWQMVRKI